MVMPWKHSMRRLILLFDSLQLAAAWELLYQHWLKIKCHWAALVQIGRAMARCTVPRGGFAGSSFFRAETLHKNRDVGFLHQHALHFEPGHS